ncbi:hypothetical protein [Agrococcus carbonis]|nr:hypothetical protein [Agrococcus carbonis]
MLDEPVGAAQPDAGQPRAEEPRAEEPRADQSGATPLPTGEAESDAVLARRAQMLATEHWGLLAARSTAQSEVLTRITIFLTLVSAGLVTIGILGQASRYAGWFSPAMLAILGFVALIGAMTQQRVLLVSEEDLMYVLGMNRLRGGYVDLDPQVGQYFLASSADDQAGASVTYSFLRARSQASHLLGSSMVLILVVNACVYGLLAGAFVVSLGAAPGWAIAAGALVGAAWMVVWMRIGYTHYRAAIRAHTPRRSSGSTAWAP